MSTETECPECGATLKTPEAADKHEKWHRKLDRRLASKVSNQPIGNQ